ncbi:hypothetical protein B1748_01410 [Paenibacillus sp. MY03]|uniref:S-layer homology domain-containing protein n=1 Tax=Paenibacillus sp. MY03 TaxID=302980 RepID=UPI000B3CA0D9|nr:S-layer homology domain-containing protein [Paenibacillus sp. MY03]OUS78761.1 hypothetical protein B1748_01410 [Paenibacillus sp. MY03]
MKKLKYKVQAAFLSLSLIMSITLSSVSAEQLLLGVYVPPQPGFINDEQYDLLQEAGINWIHGGIGFTEQEMNEMLDLSDERDIRVSVGDLDYFGMGNTTDDKLSMLAKRYKDHPATGGYSVRDEPSASMFRGYANAYNYMAQEHPESKPYLNLFPNYASDLHMGISLNLMFAQKQSSSAKAVSSVNAVGQTFMTAVDTHFIDTIELFIPKASWVSGLLTLSLWDSPAKTTKLASSKLGYTNNGDYPRFQLHAGVSPNTSYYWELTNDQGIASMVAQVQHSTTDVYAQGAAYENGGLQGNQDFYFIIYNGTKYSPASSFQWWSGNSTVVKQEQPVGQSFYNPKWNSKIKAIDVYLDSWSWDEGEELTLNLYDSPAKNNLIASGMLPRSNNLNYPTFDLNVDVEPDTSYYWELAHNGGGDNSVSSIQASTVSRYSDGAAYLAGVEQNWDIVFNVYSEDIPFEKASAMGQYDTSRNEIAVGDGTYDGDVVGEAPVMFSPDNLGIDLTTNKQVRIRVKNDTAGDIGQLFFITTEDPNYDLEKYHSFYIKPYDTEYSEYVFDMSYMSTWTGTLKELRIGQYGGTSGAMSVDYVKIMPAGKEWNFTSDVEGWQHNEQITNVSITDGAYQGEVTGGDPSLYSPDNLNLDASKVKLVKVRLKNETNSALAQVFFTTNSDPTLSGTKVLNFNINPNDPVYREYILDMSYIPEWTGTIKQIRFDPNVEAMSGTFSIDYIHLMPDATKAWYFSKNTEGWRTEWGMVNGRHVPQGIGQTFTTPSQIDRRLAYIEVALDEAKWAANGEVTLTLYESTAKKQIVGQAKLSKSNNGNYPKFYLDAKLLPNTSYYFELTQNGSGDVWVSGSTADAYAAGAAYYNGTAQDYDLYFRTVFNSTYQDYVDALIMEVGADNLSYLSVDNYPYPITDGSFIADYFANLEMMRDAAVHQNIPMQFYMQSVGIPGGLRLPNEAELRYNVYNSLAYGMKSLQYFVWATIEGFTDSIIKADGTPSPLYPIVQGLNNEVLALGPILMDLTSQSVYHSGDMPRGTLSAPIDFFWQPVSNMDQVIISYFLDSEGRKYVMVVNKDYAHTQSYTFDIDQEVEAVYEVSKETGEKVTTNYDDSTGKLSASFLPGEGKLFALAYPYDAAPPVKEWEFSTNADTEGWIANNEISASRVSFGSLNGQVTGDSPVLTSADDLNIDISNHATIKLKMRNGTASALGQVNFTTTDDAVWDEAKSLPFALVPHDRKEREYVLDLSSVAGWEGTLKQLRIVPSADVETGTFSIDYVRITDTPAKIWRFSVDDEGWIASGGLTNVTVDGAYNATLMGTQLAEVTNTHELGIDISNNKRVELVIKNNSNRSDGQLSFTTKTDAVWNNEKRVDFSLVANDTDYSTYVVDLSATAGWTGTLKNLKVGFAGDGDSGSIQIEEIRIANSSNNEGAVYQGQLKVLIAKAEATLAGVVEGTEPGQYPVGSMTTLTQAIEDAALLVAEGTAVERKQGLAALRQTIVDFSNALIVDPELPYWTDGSVTATNVTSSNVTLTWSGANDLTGVTGYRIYQNDQQVAQVAGSVTQYTVTDLTPGTSYTFGVEAIDADDQLSIDGPRLTVRTSVVSSGGDGGGSIVQPPVEPKTGVEAELVLEPGATGRAGIEGEISVTIPSGATNQALKMMIHRVSDHSGLAQANQPLVSPVFDIVKNFREPFDKSVTVTLTYDASKLHAFEKPVIFTYDATTGQWVEVTSVVLENKQVSAVVDQLGIFAVFAVNPSLVLTDITNHWAESYVREAVALDIVRGYLDSTFKPNAEVTRAEFVVMLARALGLQGSGNTLSFKDDASIGSWARSAVAQVLEAGIVNGYADQTFRPNAAISRTEMVTMVMRALQINLPEASVTSFNDDRAIPAWAKAYVQGAFNEGLISGRSGNQFAPNETATRAEAIKVLMTARN